MSSGIQFQLGIEQMAGHLNHQCHPIGIHHTNGRIWFQECSTYQVTVWQINVTVQQV